MNKKIENLSLDINSLYITEHLNFANSKCDGLYYFVYKSYIPKIRGYYIPVIKIGEISMINYSDLSSSTILKDSVEKVINGLVAGNPSLVVTQGKLDSIKVKFIKGKIIWPNTRFKN